ncbi:hypothetical protein UZ36_07780, partial [Candidatus Nitromaritima sp. SCGC AAA799-C22]
KDAPPSHSAHTPEITITQQGTDHGPAWAGPKPPSNEKFKVVENTILETGHYQKIARVPLWENVAGINKVGA